MNAEEVERRKSRTDLTEELFRSRPGVWINVPELVDVAGLCAWRTRVSDLRRRLKHAGEGDIEWNGEIRRSAYRWVRGPTHHETGTDTRRVATDAVLIMGCSK